MSAAKLLDQNAKGLRLILLSFFFPLAVYLLLLGFINRGRHPVLVSGVWDGIGLILGVSGFLLFAGPAALSTLSEPWRLFWLFGPRHVSFAGANGGWAMWIFLSVLYFLLVVGGIAVYLWRQRRLTAIYNTNVAVVERLLTDICKKLGIEPIRSGGLFMFALSARPDEGREQTAIISSPSYERKEAWEAIPDSRGSPQEQSAILEVDSFPLLHHVTLCWEPADWSLRRTVETELSRRLSETHSDDSLLGGWLLTLGFVMLSVDLVGLFFLILLSLHTIVR